MSKQLFNIESPDGRFITSVSKLSDTLLQFDTNFRRNDHLGFFIGLIEHPYVSKVFFSMEGPHKVEIHDNFILEVFHEDVTTLMECHLYETKAVETAGAN